MFDWLQRLFSSSPPQHTPAPPAPVARPAASAAASAVTTPAAAVFAVPPLAEAASAGPSFDQRDGIDHEYASWLFDHKDNGALELNLLERNVLAALDTLVKSPESGADQVRRLPRVIPEILQALRSENFSGSKISARIASDAVLVAAVISMANSTLAPGGRAIGSVEQAVIAIGQQGLRELIMKVAFRPIIDLKSGPFTRGLAPRVWDQTERCALANRLLADTFGVPPFDAFLAGLMQNVGLMVALRTMDQVAGHNKVLGTPLFYTLLMRHARQLSINIGRVWGMPEAVLDAIGEQLAYHKQAELTPLGQLLALSDYLSKARQLADHNRLGRLAATLFDALPALARPSFTQLLSSEQIDPGGVFHPVQ